MSLTFRESCLYCRLRRRLAYEANLRRGNARGEMDEAKVEVLVRTSISRWFHDRAPRKRSPVYRFWAMHCGEYRSRCRWPLQLDAVAFGIVEIDGRSAAFGAVPGHFLTAFYSM